jgi:methyl-accepting chemotaxis protein
LQNVDAESEDFETTLQSIKGILGGIGSGVVDGVSDKLGADLNDVRAYADSVNKTADAQRNLDQANKQVKESSATVGEAIDNARGKQ